MLNSYKVLSNGVKVPGIGFGTWQTPSGDVAVRSVIAALKSGYRHIDTAACYGNEKDIGEGIRKSGIKREEIFLTSKHWITERGYTKTIEAVESSLRALNTDYLDLYLIHWPCVSRSHPNWQEINASTWQGFERLYREGKLRAIGVSNFLPEHILALEKTAEIQPMVNQIEFHPGYYQAENTRWCQEHGIMVEAWSPLGCGAVLQDETLQELAQKYHKTTAQICIRFALQQGVLPLPKSVHPERIEENIQVFDFQISEEDITRIKTIPPVGYSAYHPAEAPADTLFGGNYDCE